MASGDTLIEFLPHQNDPPDADFATLRVRGDERLVLAFDDSASPAEFACFHGVMPRHYDGGGVTVQLTWGVESDTAGNVVWDVAFERIGDAQQNIDTAGGGFAADNSSGGIAKPTSTETEVTTIAFTDGADMDSVAAGEHFRIRIKRDTTDAADTKDDDAELHSVEIKET